MGPIPAKSYQGNKVVSTNERAVQEVDYGCRDKAYVFGALKPATGEVLTETFEQRSAANWVDFLERVDAWIPKKVQTIYAINDNLGTHRSVGVLLFSLRHPRWEFVFQPKYAPYLNLIEPWWKVLRSLALNGRRFENWDEIAIAIDAGTQYWNKHRHPFLWGHRRRHRSRRKPGIASVPGVRGLTR